MNSFYTVVALAVLASCIFCAYMAYTFVQRCETVANRLRASTGRITGLEGSVDSLTQQLQKLRGTFYAFKAAAEPPDFADFDDHKRPNPVVPEVRSPFCANYGQAQIEGPLSPAARCECGYCEEMRQRRSELRARHVPKTAQGQARMAKVNAGRGDGE